MRRLEWLGLVMLVVVIGCTTERNPRYCGDGVCIDPTYPFCDRDGQLGGAPAECIAVACKPGELVACREDSELRCNLTGTNYDLARCELGCDSSAGCRSCEPNETTCTNGAASTCDAFGNAGSSEPCVLGCFHDEPRCRDIDPSNDLAAYLDLVPDPPDLVLDNATIDTDTGAITTLTGTVQAPNFRASNGNGPPIRVFLVRSALLKNVVASSSSDPSAVSGPALAIVSHGDIIVEGRVRLDGRAGGVASAPCRGSPGIYFEADSFARASGSGGGAHATAGARGGNIDTAYLGGAGGEASGNESLVPLRGGCPSGGASTETSTYLFGARGGGAIQLSSRTRIDVRGIIDVRGDQGFVEQAGTIGATVAGGGAGGGVLLEAPTVVLGADAKLIAKGGGGGSLGTAPPINDTLLAARGTPCLGACPDGGDGATTGVPAAPGESAPLGPSEFIFSGGGGGGLGRVRINTADATYAKASSTVEAAVVTTSILRTR